MEANSEYLGFHRDEYRSRKLADSPVSRSAGFAAAGSRPDCQVSLFRRKSTLSQPIIADDLYRFQRCRTRLAAVQPKSFWIQRYFQGNRGTFSRPPRLFEMSSS